MYKVTIIETKIIHTFKSIKKAIKFIENWGIENKQHIGKVDIDTKTLLWNVGTFKSPIVQFEKLNKINNKYL